MVALLVFIAVTAQVALSTACTPPTEAVLWDTNPEQIIHTVVWGYTMAIDKCNVSDGCNTTDDSVPVQLPPIHMQLGSILRFANSSHEGIPLPVKPTMVDQAGFLSCDASHGQAIVTSETNETAGVDVRFLSPGTHYFIQDSSGLSLDDCIFGLRVKVVVKGSACGSQGQDVTCGGRGLCATFPDETSYRCLCCGTYQGEACENFNPCLSNPCGTRGQCVQEADNSEDFTCECSLEYFGKSCQIKRDNLCDVIKCQNNGTCTGNSTSFQCDCPDGLTGSHCEVNVNDCTTSSCVHGACVDELDGFRCHCKPGFYGETCSKQRRGCSLSPCKNGGYCQDNTTDPNHFLYTCHCLPGWEGEVCTTKVDPCQRDTCSGHGDCHEDRLTGFRCSCHAGFTGSRCEVNINDCSPNPCKYGGHCRDGLNSHTCMCINAHVGSNCQFAIDLFSPLLEGPSSGRGLNRDHRRSLYVVVGVLAAAVVAIVVVLVVCFCRISGVYRECCCCWNFNSWLRYRKHRDSLVVGVDVSSANDCPLAIDAFCRQEGLDPSTDAYMRPHHGIFENQTV